MTGKMQKTVTCPCCGQQVEIPKDILDDAMKTAKKREAERDRLRKKRLIDPGYAPHKKK